MKVKKVWITCGPPGSGKSTFLAKHAQGPIISRDNIRFAFLEEGSDYFSMEDIVWTEFIKQIQFYINNIHYTNIYIDATHLNRKSRNKLLTALDLSNVTEINALCFNTSLDTCLKRNAQRSGLAKVPETAIKNMYKSYQYPNNQENFNKIIIIDEEGKEFNGSDLVK